MYPSAPPAYEPPSVEYDKWTPIDQGTWSHERYEKEKDAYRLNTTLVRWNDDLIDYFYSNGE